MDNPIIKNGVFLALASIILQMGAYTINKSYLASMWMILPSFALLIFFMVKSVRDHKANNGGYASFGEALKSTFGTYFISTVIGIIFTYLLYNFIDPDLTEMIKQQAIATAESVSEMLGQEMDDEVLDQLENQDFSMSFGKILANSIFPMIMGFVISLIVSAITKKNPPMGGALDNV